MPEDWSQGLSPFSQVAALLLACAFLGALFVRLRQPVLITYIVAGIALGPAGVGLVAASPEIEMLAKLGVTVLLFIVGLKLDLQHVRHIGPVALATGLGQLAFTIVIGFLITLALGKGWLEAVYIAVALTFSSTIIIVKLLSDKRELDTLHGRIAVGFLIVQDVAVVVAMMVMSTMKAPGGQGGLYVLVSLLLRVGATVALTIAVMRWVLPPIVRLMARSQELLLLFAVAWGGSLAALGEWAGFSMEAGAFLAGFTLASTPFRDSMSARLTSLRDFLLLFFFIELGAKLEIASLGAELLPAILLSLFVLIGNPFIVTVIMGSMGYRKRTSFLAGLTVAQISEFSIVFVAMGISLGHVGVEALGLTTLVGMVTITVSTYMILYSQPLFERLSPWLSSLERRHPFRELEVEKHQDEGSELEAVVFGLGRYGRRVLATLCEANVRAIGVDFDPEEVRLLQARGLPVRFGDGEDPAFVQALPLGRVRWVLTTLPQWAATRALLQELKTAGYEGSVAVVVRDDVTDRELDVIEADRVLRMFDDAADHAAQALIAGLQPSP